MGGENKPIQNGQNPNEQNKSMNIIRQRHFKPPNSLIKSQENNGGTKNSSSNIKVNKTQTIVPQQNSKVTQTTSPPSLKTQQKNDQVLKKNAQEGKTHQSSEEKHKKEEQKVKEKIQNKQEKSSEKKAEKNEQKVESTNAVDQVQQNQLQESLFNLNEALNQLLVRSLLMNAHSQEIKRGQEAPEGKVTRRRIQNELKQILQNPPVEWRVIDSSEWNQWTVQINISGHSPFNTLPIFMTVLFPNDYPYFRPYLCLRQPHRFFHPNIYSDGSICEQLINKFQDSTVNVRGRIDGFVFILSNANPQSPANHKAAELYRQDYRAYRKKAFKIFREVDKLMKNEK